MARLGQGSAKAESAASGFFCQSGHTTWHSESHMREPSVREFHRLQTALSAKPPGQREIASESARVRDPCARFASLRADRPKRRRPSRGVRASREQGASPRGASQPRGRFRCGVLAFDLCRYLVVGSPGAGFGRGFFSNALGLQTLSLGLGIWCLRPLAVHPQEGNIFLSKSACLSSSG